LLRTPAAASTASAAAAAAAAEAAEAEAVGTRIGRTVSRISFP